MARRIWGVLALTLSLAGGAAMAQAVKAPPTADQVLAVLKKGDVAAAAALAREVDDANQVIRMRADKRFDPVLNPDRDYFDISAVHARAIANGLDEVARRPRRAVSVHRLASAYLKADRHQEALALMDAAIAKGPVGYEDGVAWWSWNFNRRATALYGLGRRAEAQAAMRLAATAPEAGHPNVSQVLNLGTALVEEGRPEEALQTVAQVKRTSPYGRSVQLKVQACAEAALGRREDAAKTLKTLAAVKVAVRSMLQEAYLCLDRDDEGAQLLIARLNDEGARGEALLFVQRYRSPAPRTEAQTRRAAALERLRGRPDVSAVIDRVGRIETYGEDASPPLDRRSF